MSARTRIALAAVVAALSLAVVAAPASAGVPDQQQTTSNGASGIDGPGPPGGSEGFSVAQTFTAGLTGQQDQVDLLLARFASATEPLTVEIRDVDLLGLPGSTVLASASVPAADVPVEQSEGFKFVAASFASPVPVDAGSQYAIVAYASGSDHYGNGQFNPGPYAGGARFFSFSSPPTTWGSSSADFAFKTYVIPDQEHDGVPDAGDNCPTVANPDQVNTDGDESGDACDSDNDNDGVADTGDNCRLVVNQGQQDLDGDGAGDACDADDDGDGAPDTADNCAVANAGQANIDGDAAGDACDADDDNDGLSDVVEGALGSSSADLDSDDDGLADAREDRNGDGKKGRRETSAVRFDTDRDGLSDGLERGLRRGVADPAGPVAGTGRRFRRDRHPGSKTNPLERDTDNGGVPDGREDANRNGRVDKGETDPTKRDGESRR